MDRLFPKETIKNTAESIGITNLKDNVAATLALDVEYRIHEIIQEANKFMRHSKRTKLTGEDINNALHVRNVDPLYGFTLTDNSKFQRVTTNQHDLFYVDDDEYEFENLIDSAMPKLPTEVTFTAHWLAVAGIVTDTRKKVPTNTIVQVPNGVVTGTPEIEVKPLVQHILSKELQLFYEKVINTMQSEDDSKLRVSVLNSLEHDTGLAQLLPYFIQFICEKIGQNIKKNSIIVNSMLNMTDSLINNNSLYLEPYLHHLMPAILTCAVRKKIGVDFDKHWETRELAAHILAKICDRFGASYNTLQPKIIRTLLSAFTDPSKSLSTHYGCIVAMGALGREVIRSILVPNLKTYSEILSLQKNNREALQTIDPLINNQMRDEDLRQKLVDKIGEYFAKGVMSQIGDEQVIMAIINC
ncbi:7800_t:CDS:2 [Diversispora eburnea]|uniref:TBP-associated factor 6 n=1 Tax=Diversispora eburnea TaxID=1213867 RepID=A0A9N8YN16_9GLOM|nr:7800_t:CDS:2 [Diversispora eburnea]